METLFLRMLNMSITATYVILAVLLIRLLLKRAPKKYSYLLWAVVLFRLVSPVSFTSELSLLNAPPFDMTTAQQSGDEALKYVPADVGYMEMPKVTVGIPTLNTFVSDTLPAATPADSVNPLQIWVRIGTMLWSVGMTVLLSYSFVAYIRLRRRLSTAIWLDSHIYESDRMRSPFILGFFKPRIYIPFGLNEQERSYILQHEVYHLKRKDNLIKPIAFLVLVLHWFNPFVWLAFTLMSKDMEMSCDEKVLAKVGANKRKEYCSSLLSFATNRRFPAVSPLAFGETDVRERVTNILRFKAPKKGVATLLAIACVVVIAACATNPTAKEVQKEDMELHGSYSFEKQIYMNPLSSFSGREGLKEYYTFTKDTFTINAVAGNLHKSPVVYERETVDMEEFQNSFLFGTDVGPDISSYKQRYQYTLTDPSVSPGYRLYLLDDEIWLAKLQSDNVKFKKNEYIWSIYKIAKSEGRIPGKAAIVGTSDGVEPFQALHKDFKSGYDKDTSYNITPEYIKENSDYQIFKYDTSSASFLMYGGKIYTLGESLGGSGVTSMALADVDDDGQSELYFTYSWGSGMHRSHVAYFDPISKQVVTLDYAHLNRDMLIVDNDDGSLSLFDAKLANYHSFVNFEIVGNNLISDIVYTNNKISLNSVKSD